LLLLLRAAAAAAVAVGAAVPPSAATDGRRRRAPRPAGAAVLPPPSCSSSRAFSGSRGSGESGIIKFVCEVRERAQWGVEGVFSVFFWQLSGLCRSGGAGRRSPRGALRLVSCALWFSGRGPVNEAGGLGGPRGSPMVVQRSDARERAGARLGDHTRTGRGRLAKLGRRRRRRRRRRHLNQIPISAARVSLPHTRRTHTHKARAPKHIHAFNSTA
jgi:hypothetical protein